MRQSPDTQKHTPGPWKLEREGKIRLLVRTQPDRCYAFHPDDEANARLIASAPDLLEALKALVALVDYSDFKHPESQGLLETSQTAIDKAEGHYV